MKRIFWFVINSILVVIGGIMAFASDFVSLLPDDTLLWPADTIRLCGLALFMFSVFLYMITSQYEDIRKEMTNPRLVLGKLSTVFKHAFKNGEKIGEWYFASVYVENNPKDWNSGQSAEKTTADILFTNQGGISKKIEYGRWWDKDIPLFPRKISDVKSLKQIDIDPGLPESLVLAYRKKEGTDIYAFYYTDYQNIENLYDERIIGKPPVEITIRLRGRFNPQEFKRKLDIDNNGEFIFIEKPDQVDKIIQTFTNLWKQLK